MAIGKNLKKGSKEESPKKEQVKEIKKVEQMEVAIETTKTTAPKPLIQETSKAVPAKEKQSLSQLNHDLEVAQQVKENSKMLVVFPVGQEEYAFEIAQIKEVVPVPPVSPVPQTKSYIRGVANVRGNVLAVIDLARKFGLKKGQEEDAVNYVIVVNSEKIKVAVASSQVPETLMIKESQIDSTMDVMRKSGNEQNFIKGIIKKDNRMIIFIDILEMVQNEQPVNG